MLKITGYPDRYSVAPGEKIDFKISLEEGIAATHDWYTANEGTGILRCELR